MRISSRVVVCASFVAALVVFGAGCGGDEAGDTAGDTAGATSSAAMLEGDLTVAAASSLESAFTRIGDDFRAEHPGVGITFTFDSSSTLAAQLLEGAPADVFASADEANMAKLSEAGLVAGVPVVFARNELVIVTKPGNPEGITGLADLADVGVVSLCGTDVPCGRYAQEALDAAGVAIPESSVTRGQNAGATLTAVSEGDAVAGIVYVTDAAKAGEAVDEMTIPAGQNVIASYPIATLASSGEADAAAAFVAFVSSDAGQAVLEELGFLPSA